jgi:DNA adenine methylase
MKYMGSKARFSKEILPIILKDRTAEQWYVEPFAGGMNMICEVDGKRIANDKNKYLIAMWKGLVEGRERLNEIPKELYNRARVEYNNATNVDFDDFTIGWIGWMASFNGRFFDGGYSGKSNTKIGTVRNYIKEAISNIEKQLPKMVGVQFENKDYTELEIPTNSIIYCDIPYQGTADYGEFNHKEFFDWAAEQVHPVFVSEYNMLKDLINNNIYETAEAIQNYYHNEFGTFITFSNSLKITKMYMNNKERIEELSHLFE